MAKTTIKLTMDTIKFPIEWQQEHGRLCVRYDNGAVITVGNRYGPPGNTRVTLNEQPPNMASFTWDSLDVFTYLAPLETYTLLVNGVRYGVKASLLNSKYSPSTGPNGWTHVTTEWVSGPRYPAPYPADWFEKLTHPSNYTGDTPVQIPSGLTLDQVSARRDILEATLADPKTTLAEKSTAVTSLEQLEKQYPSDSDAKVPQNVREQLVAAINETNSILQESDASDATITSIGQSVFVRVLKHYSLLASGS